MHLNNDERDILQDMVERLHAHWAFYLMRRIKKVHDQIFAILLILCLGAMGTAFFLLPEDQLVWAMVSFSGIFLVLCIFSSWWQGKKIKAIFQDNAPKRWIHEIETLQVDNKEYQLFCHLLSIIPTTSREEVKRVVNETLQHPHLSQLTFLKRLNIYLQ